MVKYKIYILKESTTHNDGRRFLIEADFNYVCGFDTMEEALERLSIEAVNYVNYTIIPYIYLAD